MNKNGKVLSLPPHVAAQMQPPSVPLAIQVVHQINRAREQVTFFIGEADEALRHVEGNALAALQTYRNRLDVARDELGKLHAKALTEASGKIVDLVRENVNACVDLVKKLDDRDEDEK